MCFFFQNNTCTFLWNGKFQHFEVQYYIHHFQCKSNLILAVTKNYPALHIWYEIYNKFCFFFRWNFLTLPYFLVYRFLDSVCWIFYVIWRGSKSMYLAVNIGQHSKFSDYPVTDVGMYGHISCNTMTCVCTFNVKTFQCTYDSTAFKNTSVRSDRVCTLSIWIFWPTTLVSICKPKSFFLMKALAPPEVPAVKVLSTVTVSFVAPLM